VEAFIWVMMVLLLLIGIISVLSDSEGWVGIQVATMLSLVIGTSVIYIVS
jgi:hypothetical protein